MAEVIKVSGVKYALLEIGKELEHGFILRKFEVLEDAIREYKNTTRDNKEIYLFAIMKEILNQ